MLLLSEGHELHNKTVKIHHGSEPALRVERGSERHGGPVNSSAKEKLPILLKLRSEARLYETDKTLG